MNIASFLQLNTNPDDADDEAYSLACDQAEGAIRAGVTLSLAEYAAMTPDLRAAFIVAGNRILRDRRPTPYAEPNTTRDDVSAWADQLTRTIFGEGA